MKINVPASTLHKAIAALAEYLEDEFSSELFSSGGDKHPRMLPV
jgi:hypothetical protein